MRTIRILALHQTLPKNKSVVTLFFDNILPILKKKYHVHLMWFVYMPDRIDVQTDLENNVSVFDIHDYENAYDFLEKEKPTFIFANTNPTFVDYSFSLAAKFLGIPVLSGLYGRDFDEMSRERLIVSYLSRFFQNTVPTDSQKQQKKFLRRGGFIIYKYLFLLKTQKAIKMKKIQIIKNFFMLCRVFLKPTDFLVDSRFANTIHWMEGEYYYNLAIKNGFDKNTLFLTGNPLYDSVFKKFMLPFPIKKESNQVKILLITSAMYEHGIWTRSERDSLVQGIVKEIHKHKDEMQLSVKIHPSSENLTDYESIITPIDPSIEIHQTGDVLDFIYEADIVIGFLTHSALEYTLFSKKPIIICNLYELKGDVFLEKGLALECKNLSLLVPLIHKALQDNPATEQKVDSYVKEYLYKSDGQSSERVCDVIDKILETNL